MKKITTVGFLFALLLAVALGVHHLAFAQSEASTNSPLLPFFCQNKDSGNHSAVGDAT